MRRDEIIWDETWQDNVIYGYDTTLHAAILHKMVSIYRSWDDTFLYHTTWYDLTCSNVTWYDEITCYRMSRDICCMYILCTCYCMISLYTINSVHFPGISNTCAWCWGNTKHEQINRDLLVTSKYNVTWILCILRFFHSVCVCSSKCAVHWNAVGPALHQKHLHMLHSQQQLDMENPQKRLSHLTKASLNRSCKDSLDPIAYHA